MMTVKTPPTLLLAALGLVGVGCPSDDATVAEGTDGTSTGGTSQSASSDDAVGDDDGTSTPSQGDSTDGVDDTGTTDAGLVDTGATETDGSESSGGDPLCGDGVVNGDDECDDGDLNGEDCVSLGFATGNLACAEDCSFDTSDCADNVCGDNVVGDDEVCDGVEVGAEDCASQGFDGGPLVCAKDCSGLDTSGCADFAGDCCADNGTPGCDDAACTAAVCAVDIFCCNNNWDGMCATAAFGESDCEDVGGSCPVNEVCGDGVAEGVEPCDGDDLLGQDCISLGATSGELGCAGNCSSLDTSGCLYEGCEDEDIGSNIGPSVATGDLDLADDDLPQGCANGGGDDHVVAFTAATAGEYVFDTAGSNYDTALAIFADCNPANELACDDDDGPGLTSEIVLNLAAGQQVFVAVGGFGGSSGDYILNIGAPLCGNAMLDVGELCDTGNLNGEDCDSQGFVGGPLACGGDCASFDTSACTEGGCEDEDIGGTTGAAVTSGDLGIADDDLPQSCAGGGGDDHVVAFTAGAAGDYTFDTEGSDYDTALAIFATCNAGTELACDDDGGAGSTSSITISLEAGEQVFVSVGGFGAAEGNYVLNVTPLAVPFGVDPFYEGYASTPAVLPCDDISATGTPTGLTDDSVLEVPIGFTMALHGADYTDVAIESNGTLHWGDDDYLGFANTCLPTGVTPSDNVLYVFWDDLNPSVGAGEIYYETLGAPGDQRFVVQFDVANFGGDAVDLMRFQTMFYEATGAINVCYVDTQNGGNGANDGAEATAGLQLDDMTAVQYSCNTPDMTDGTLLQFLPV